MRLFTSARTVATVFARPAGSEAMYCAGVLTFDGGFMDSWSSRTKCVTDRLKTSQRQGCEYRVSPSRAQGACQALRRWADQAPEARHTLAQRVSAGCVVYKNAEHRRCGTCLIPTHKTSCMWCSARKAETKR